MAYPAEHSARQADPDRFVEFRRENDEFGPGRDVVYGVRTALGPEGGRTEVQSIRFDARLHSRDDALEWLRDNDFSTRDFMPAAGRANPSRGEQWSGLIDAAERYAARETVPIERRNALQAAAQTLRERQNEALEIDTARSNPRLFPGGFGTLLLPDIESKRWDDRGSVMRWITVAAVGLIITRSFPALAQGDLSSIIPTWLQDAA